MSTYYGFRCHGHVPPIDSEPWHNHGAARLRLALQFDRHLVREYLNLCYNLPAELEWLAEHVECDVTVVSEYE